MRNRSSFSVPSREAERRVPGSALSMFGYAHWRELQFIADYVSANVNSRRDRSVDDQPNKTIGTRVRGSSRS